MNLRIRLDHLLLGVGAVALLLGALWAWRTTRADTEQPQLDGGLERLRQKPGPRKPVGPSFLRGSGGFSSERASEERQGWAESHPPHLGDPGELDAAEAIDTFQAVLDELETALDEGRRFSRLERAQLYNRATGSFIALSAWTDGSDPNDRALLDDAYARMMALLRELKIEPPRHDPDYNPMIQ